MLTQLGSRLQQGAASPQGGWFSHPLQPLLQHLSQRTRHAMGCAVWAPLVGGIGTSTEAEKNLTFRGLDGIAVCDQTPAATVDVATTFFVHEADIGQPLESDFEAGALGMRTDARKGTVALSLASPSPRRPRRPWRTTACARSR